MSVGNLQEMSVRDLFALQYFDDKFIGYPIVARFMFLEEFYGVDTGGYRLYYNLLYAIRNSKDYAETRFKKFQKLIKSFESEGYDKNSYIELFQNSVLFTGRHRIALALYNNLSTIPVEFVSKRMFIANFSIDWFFLKGFSLEEIQLLQDKSDELKEKFAVVFIGFLWAPALSYAENIFDVLRFFGKIIDTNDYRFSSLDQYHKFVSEIYSRKNLSDDKLKEIFQCFSDYEPRFISFKFKAPSQYFMNPKNYSPMSQTIDRVEFIIRDRYKKILCDTPDNAIILISENDLFSQHYENTLEKFKFALQM